MPTWASRLRFVIEEVGVEHVRHISVKDVEAEALSVLIGPSLCTECADGTSFKTSVVVDPYSSWRDRFDDALVSSFHTLWHDTHRRMGYPDPNKLWVWALTVRLEQDDAGE
jgi:hypothetical protein